MSCLEAREEPCVRASQRRTLKFRRGMDEAVRQYTYRYPVGNLTWNKQRAQDSVI